MSQKNNSRKLKTAAISCLRALYQGKVMGQKNNGRKPVIVLAAIFIGVGLFWGGGWYWIDHYVAVQVLGTDVSDAPNIAARGQFGDKFGAINALFSGFAFAGIIYTLFLQRGDLRETQNAMSQERFDNTFFQLLNVHISITERIVAGAGGHEGKLAFSRFNDVVKFSDQDFPVFYALQKLSRNQVRDIVDTGHISLEKYPELTDADVTNLNECRKKGVGAFNNFLDNSIEMHEKKIVEAYIEAAGQYIDDFSHYFRNLYHLLKFIDESKLISEEEKTRYSRFVRAQLSQVELVALFYNSIAKIELPGRKDMELGYPKMARLLVRFDVLQNMNPRNLFHPLHQDIFDKNNKNKGEE